MENSAVPEQEIDLVSLFFAVLHKYRQIFAAAAVGAVLLGVFGIFRNVQKQRATEQALAEGENAPRTSAEQTYEDEMVEYRAAQTKHDQDVANYTQSLSQNEADQTRAEFDIKNAQEYIDNSVLYSLDPYNVYTTDAVYYITTDYKILPGMDYQNPDYTSAVLNAYNRLLTDSETISAIAKQFDMEERYMRELIGVGVDSSTCLLTISTMGKDAKQASDIMDALLTRFTQLYDTIEDTVGVHHTAQISISNSITVSTSLREAQQSTRDNMTTLQNNLANLQAQHSLLEQNITTADQDLAALEKPKAPKSSQLGTVVKYAIIGFLLGGVLVAVVAVCRFLMEDKVVSAADLERTCGVPVLGTLANEASRNATGLDARLNKMEKRPDGSADAAITDLIAATIHSRMPQAKKILLTGDVPAATLLPLRDALQAAESMKDATLTVSESILGCASTVSQAAQADVIVLVADRSCSKYGAVRLQNEKIQSLGKSVFGCVLYA